MTHQLDPNTEAQHEAKRRILEIVAEIGTTADYQEILTLIRSI